jgi:hypothetical protein
MSTILRPTGPQPPRVYWVRRLAVLGALVLVVVLFWSLLSPGGEGGEEDSAGDPAGTGDVGEEPPADPPADAGRTCTAADLQLALTSDAGSYVAGLQPVFSLVVTNGGSTSCTVDAGPGSRELLITSGTDRVWSSLDCAGDAAEELLLLSPGTASAPIAVTWPVARSAEGCTEGLPAPGRPGTYHVIAKLLGAESADVTFTLD